MPARSMLLSKLLRSPSNVVDYQRTVKSLTFNPFKLLIVLTRWCSCGPSLFCMKNFLVFFFFIRFRTVTWILVLGEKYWPFNIFFHFENSKKSVVPDLNCRKAVEQAVTNFTSVIAAGCGILRDVENESRSNLTYTKMMQHNEMKLFTHTDWTLVSTKWWQSLVYLHSLRNATVGDLI